MRSLRPPFAPNLILSKHTTWFLGGTPKTLKHPSGSDCRDSGTDCVSWTMHGYRPPYRRLRVFAADYHHAAFDSRLDDELTLKVRWEEQLGPGPVGDSIEVVDFDAESGCFYAPVDLNAPVVLGQDGIPPAAEPPQFHQQSVYAVAMNTLEAIEGGLGRRIYWTRSLDEEQTGGEQFVQRLRIYPHAQRENTAYYSPAKKSVVMGYFSESVPSASGAPNPATSFACLLHGVVAHEVTHAVLDGIGRLATPNEHGQESVALQEGLADCVALFRQFAMPGFLARAIEFSADPAANAQRLVDLARKLAQPLGYQKELRRLIGPQAGTQAGAAAAPEVPDTGALVVAAVFEAFLDICAARTRRILKLACKTSPAEVSCALLEELPAQAEKSASHVLTICARAIDYCPPDDVTPGDFLRALITADADAAPGDDRGYRAAFVRSFRKFGLCPADLGMMTEADLMWRSAPVDIALSRVDPGPGPLNAQGEFERERRLCRDFTDRLNSPKRGTRTAALLKEMGLAAGKDAPRTAGLWGMLPAHLSPPWRSVSHAHRLRRASGTGGEIEDTGHRRGRPQVHRRPHRRAGGHPPSLGQGLRLFPRPRHLRSHAGEASVAGVDGGPGQRRRETPEA